MQAKLPLWAPLLPWRQTEHPLDWTTIFGRQAPLWLEIGCGNAEVCCRRAREHADVDFLALDLSWGSVRRATHRVSRRGLSNVRVLHAEARATLFWLIPPQTLQWVWCYFPCPWPKEKDTDKRLFQRDWLTLLNSRLKPDGGFQLITDWWPLVEWTLDEAQGSGLEGDWRPIPPVVESKYERKWRAGGQNEFFELNFSVAQPMTAPRGELLTVQNRLVEAFDPNLLRPFALYGSPGVYCRDWCYDPGQNRALGQIIAVDEGLNQAFYIEVQPLSLGWRIRVAPGSGTLPTPGIQKAIDAVRDLLEGVDLPELANHHLPHLTDPEE